MINKKIVAGVSALSVISIISGLLIYNNVTKQKGKEVLAASTQSENVKKDSNNTKKKNNNIKEEKAASVNEENTVSINYKGILTNEQAAHPSKYDFGVNVDMNSAREIRLQDIFSLSDEFYDKVKSYGVVEAESEELKDAQGHFIGDESLEDFKTSYESYYLENDGVVFVFSTCYAIGENTELKVPYSLISQYMNNGYASRVS